MSEDIEQIKQREKEFHERYREGGPLPLIDVEKIRKDYLSPCWETGVDIYSDNKMAFHEFIKERCHWIDKYVLDYGCGDALFATYYALTGASKVAGFDLAETGIYRAIERLEKQGLCDKAKLFVMDASNLDFPDNEFELVIGHGVLHHVIKYPNIFEELYRVMKPGSKAFFYEGLADFPLWKLHWKIQGEVPQGDVPIFSKEVKSKAKMFTDVEILGDTFLSSFKHFIWKRNMGSLRRIALKTLKKTDDFLFLVCPFLRRWGGFCYICLTK
jgi:ubiquinone/menaquinone biosynthesis C-methylase UbiE